MSSRDDPGGFIVLELFVPIVRWGLHFTVVFQKAFFVAEINGGTVIFEDKNFEDLRFRPFAEECSLKYGGIFCWYAKEK